MESSALLLFFITAIALVALAVLFASFVPPSSFNPTKYEPYECGIETIGQTWFQYTVGYYMVAILFLIFDIETIFILPWATVMREMGMTGFIEIMIFFVFLGLGLFYSWKKQAFKWE